MYQPMPTTAVRGSRAAWKPALIVFAVGAAVWVAQFVWVWMLCRQGSSWYPGFPLTGGEWSGWLGLGWLVEKTYCFGTQEMCAGFDPSPTFSFRPVGTLVFFVVLAVVSLVIGLVAGRRPVRR